MTPRTDVSAGAPEAGTAEVVRFDLLGPPVLSRSAVLRDETLRKDTARQHAGTRPIGRRREIHKV